MGHDHQWEEDQVFTVGDHLGAADQVPITLQNRTLEDVITFSYLGSEVEQTGKVEKEAATRIEKAGTVWEKSFSATASVGIPRCKYSGA